MPATASLAHGSIAQTLSALLRDNILNGAFTAGQHLREAELACLFGTSRTPVRHALAANEKDGLLDYTAHRGFVVRAFDVMDMDQAYEMRALIEGYAARTAAERGLRADRHQKAAAAIESVDDLLQQDAPLDDAAREAWRSRNIEFHQAIVAQCENRFIGPMLTSVQQIPSVFPPVLTTYEASALRIYNDQHRAILASILRREGTRAEFLMRDHVTLSGEAIRATVGTTNIDAG